MSKKNSKIKIFVDDPNLLKPSPDRPHPYLLEGTNITIYLNDRVYELAHKLDEAEYTARRLESRCLIPDGHGGYKRCMLDCKNYEICKKPHRDGHLLSLDRLHDEYQYEPAGDDDVMEYINKKDAIERAKKIMFELLGIEGFAIMHMHFYEIRQAEIAKKLGMSIGKVNKKIRDCTAILENFRKKMKKSECQTPYTGEGIKTSKEKKLCLQLI